MKINDSVHRFILLFTAIVSMVSCQHPQQQANPTPQNPLDAIPVINYSLIKTFPHDTSLFTEGLVVHDNLLFESTGSPRELKRPKSLFGSINLKTGKVNVKGELDKKYFGEGIAFLKDKMYQLTYKNHAGFIYDAKTFKMTGRFSFDNKEGWGMTSDGINLIMSDGTYVLTYLEPENLRVAKILNVTANGQTIYNLNELEYIHGFIYANIWETDYIVKINPQDGTVVGKIDLSTLHNEAKTMYPDADVLNGIAYDSIANKTYVTGKLWPYIYQINLP